MTPDSPYLTAAEAAKFLRLSYKRFCNQRLGIPSDNSSGRPLFTHEQLAEWLANRGKVPAAKSRIPMARA
jgi:hypothetical protein